MKALRKLVWEFSQDKRDLDLLLYKLSHGEKLSKMAYEYLTKLASKEKEVYDTQ